MPRQPSCTCGDCSRCHARRAAREAYQAMTPEQRRAWVARRDPEKVRAADRARYERERPKRIAAMKAYGETEAGKKKKAAANKAWRERHPERVRAHSAVARAVRRGELVRGACEQAGPGCRGRIHAHHDDYARPLDVRWLCAHHHKVAHAAKENR